MVFVGWLLAIGEDPVVMYIHMESVGGGTVQIRPFFSLHARTLESYAGCCRPSPCD